MTDALSQELCSASPPNPASGDGVSPSKAGTSQPQTRQGRSEKAASFGAALEVQQECDELEKLSPWLTLLMPRKDEGVVLKLLGTKVKHFVCKG